MNRLLSLLTIILKEHQAFAHCDIPCGIYDPHNAQMAAHTIMRMTQLALSVKTDDQLKLAHDLARITKVKEDHADLVEEELTTLRNDYFKENHFKENLELKDIFSNALHALSEVRQELNLQAAEELLENVLKIAEVFYKTKGVTPLRVKSVYPTEKEIVIYK